MQTITSDQINNIFLRGKPAILDKFDKLKDGQAFILKNYYNPIPLFYQLIRDRGNVFTWEYIEKGPKIWRVKITKSYHRANDFKIGSLAVKDYRKAELFQRLGINYCCGGDKSFEEACIEAGISLESWNELYMEAIQHSDKEIYAFDKWESGFLADYIVNTHHHYVNQNSELISRLAFKVASRHGHENPGLKELSEQLDYFFEHLQQHMEKEEEVLFPLIKELTAAKRSGNTTVLQNIKLLLENAMEDHKNYGETLSYIKKVTSNYQLRADACSSYIQLYAKLMEFENDLIQHVHLENNVLFPRLKSEE